MRNNIAADKPLKAYTNAALSDWDPRFVERHPLFAPLAPLASQWAQHADWPDRQTCNALLQSSAAPVITGHGVNLRAVAQDARPNDLALHYEMRILTRGELQTRARSWHDWLNLLVWRTFPQSKRILNAVHCGALAQTVAASSALPTRNPQANACTLFDENGAVVLASDPALLELVRAFRWSELFWTRRAALKQALRCVVFGHSLYEKGLRPYFGMTAHAILLPTHKAILQLPWPSLLTWLDEMLADRLAQPSVLADPRQLQPFPLLGMPGWDPANEEAAYYDDNSYFRPGRRPRSAPRVP